MISTITVAVAMATLLAAEPNQAAPAGEAEISAANKLYLQSVVEGDRASKLERRGKEEAAIHAYELAGRLSEASIAEGGADTRSAGESAAGSLFPLRDLVSARGAPAQPDKERLRSS
ncbi:MAG TPA: hypothetical protein VK993_14930 [Chthoniobacterales bacterium]|nr:hypothetical protein [Chthoniobacterales bacterium]